MSADKNIEEEEKEATPPPEQQIEDCRDHRERLIDAALEESFPASDPPSIARPACLDDLPKDR